MSYKIHGYRYRLSMEIRIQTSRSHRNRDDCIQDAVEKIFDIGPIDPWPDKKEAIANVLKALLQEVVENGNGRLTRGSR